MSIGEAGADTRLKADALEVLRGGEQHGHAASDSFPARNADGVTFAAEIREAPADHRHLQSGRNAGDQPGRNLGRAIEADMVVGSENDAGAEASAGEKARAHHWPDADGHVGRVRRETDGDKRQSATKRHHGRSQSGQEQLRLPAFEPRRAGQRDSKTPVQSARRRRLDWRDISRNRRREPGAKIVERAGTDSLAAQARRNRLDREAQGQWSDRRPSRRRRTSLAIRAPDGSAIGLRGRQRRRFEMPDVGEAASQLQLGNVARRTPVRRRGRERQARRFVRSEHQLRAEKGVVRAAPEKDAPVESAAAFLRRAAEEITDGAVHDEARLPNDAPVVVALVDLLPGEVADAQLLLLREVRVPKGHGHRGARQRFRERTEDHAIADRLDDLTAVAGVIIAWLTGEPVAPRIALEMNSAVVETMMSPICSESSAIDIPPVPGSSGISASNAEPVATGPGSHEPSVISVMNLSQSQTAFGHCVCVVFVSASEWPRMCVRSFGMPKQLASQQTNRADSRYCTSVGNRPASFFPNAPGVRAPCSMPMLSRLAEFAW